jgi:sigma-B regulation protein RsbU (phosphoserine phosphatase)
LGAVLLLGLTVAAVSYALIVNEKKTLTRGLENTLVLQGRNIALSSEKALLRADPEFELFPLVARILDQQKGVLSVTVVDAEGFIQGDRDIVNVSKLHRPDLSGRTARPSEKLKDHEYLYADENSYLFRTPVISAGKPIGHVFLEYSKHELHENIRHGVRITLLFSAASLFLGLILASLIFRHISRPMQVMLDGVNTLAEGNLGATITMPTKNEFRILAQSFNDMAFRIAAAQKEHIVKERMDRELEIARDIQHTLLPDNVRAPRGFEIGHHYKSAMEVGGDYLDVIPVGESKVGLVMADVSGKGVPGLVVMAMVKIMVQNLIGKGVPPKEIVRKLNSTLLGNIRRNMFVTFFVAILDCDNGTVVFSNAGHNPVLIYNNESTRARLLKMDGPPMGTFPDHVFAGYLREYRLELGKGDVLLQYTDGLNESMNQRGELFSFDRILEIANSCAGDGAKTLVDRLVQAEIAFRGSAAQSDDITILAVSMNTAPRREPVGQVVTRDVDTYR